MCGGLSLFVGGGVMSQVRCLITLIIDCLITFKAATKVVRLNGFQEKVVLRRPPPFYIVIGFKWIPCLSEYAKRTSSSAYKYESRLLIATFYGQVGIPIHFHFLPPINHHYAKFRSYSRVRYSSIDHVKNTKILFCCFYFFLRKVCLSKFYKICTCVIM